MKKLSCKRNLGCFNNFESCYQLTLLNYKHICALYGSKCCLEIIRKIQNRLFMLGFSFLSTTHDEMVIYLSTDCKKSPVFIESLLVFFSTAQCFGSTVPILPMLSIIELSSSCVDSGSQTSVSSRFSSSVMRIQPVKITNHWRAKYESNMNLCLDLLSLLEKGKLVLALQEVHKLNSRAKSAVIYSEALLRFLDSRVDLSVINCIEAFEATGLIRSLDRYVVKSVLARLHDDSDVVIGCNVSALSFNLDFWWATILEDLQNHPMIAARLVIELTESSAIEDYESFVGFVRKFKSLGVKFALDDFGVGMPRLGSINDFIFDYVKIDKKVFRDLVGDSAKLNLFSNMISFIKDLGARVVVEGIESKDDISTAKKFGCEFIQGYFVERPCLQRKIDLYNV